MNTHKFISILLIAVASITATPNIGATDIISQADSAYSAEKYPQAIALYNKAIAEQGSSSALYYNLGDAYYRNGELGKAVVNFHRSLRLDPTNEDAKQNIRFVKSKLVDKVGEPGSFFSNTFDALTNFSSSNTWALLSLALFLITIAGALLYLFGNMVVLRKIGFFGGIASLILTVIGIALSVHAHSLAVSTDEAVIIVPSTILSTSPRQPKDRNEEAMLLHEGTLVKIIDTVTSGSGNNAVKWCEVEVDNSHRAWIKSADIEII